MENKIGIILTQWKRNHLENQLKCITNQNIKIDYIIVFQNENHVDITNILKKFDNIIHVKSDFNITRVEFLCDLFNKTRLKRNLFWKLSSSAKIQSSFFLALINLIF